MSRSLLAGLSGFALLAAVPAQGQQLNIYNWSDYIDEGTVPAFEAESGIDVTYDVFDSNELLEGKLLAGNSGYDLVVPTGTFLARQIQAGVFQPLQPDLIPNLSNLGADYMERLAIYDPGNVYATPYLWGTTGIGYNVEAVRERLGDDAPVDSLDLIFDPANAEKLADCGISILDAPTEVMNIAANYLGLDPQAQDPDDMQAAADLLTSIRPHIRYFHSSQYLNDLAGGDVCVSIGWSGDVQIAAARAAEAGNGVEIAYTIPKEGTIIWMDVFAIPTEAENVEEAHAFLNHLYSPEVIAAQTNYVFYPNAVPASNDMIDPEILNDPTIYPAQEILDNLFPDTVDTPRTSRLRNRLWTEIKTGT